MHKSSQYYLEPTSGAPGKTSIAKTEFASTLPSWAFPSTTQAKMSRLSWSLGILTTQLSIPPTRGVTSLEPVRSAAPLWTFRQQPMPRDIDGRRAIDFLSNAARPTHCRMQCTWIPRNFQGKYRKANDHASSRLAPRTRGFSTRIWANLFCYTTRWGRRIQNIAATFTWSTSGQFTILYVRSWLVEPIRRRRFVSAIPFPSFTRDRRGFRKIGCHFLMSPATYTFTQISYLKQYTNYPLQRHINIRLSNLASQILLRWNQWSSQPPIEIASSMRSTFLITNSITAWATSLWSSIKLLHSWRQCFASMTKFEMDHAIPNYRPIGYTWVYFTFFIGVGTNGYMNGE